MATKLKSLICLLTVAATEISFGCPTCMSAGGEAVRGLFWSMMALFLTVVVLLTGLAFYFWFLRRQAKVVGSNCHNVDPNMSNTLGSKSEW